MSNNIKSGDTVKHWFAGEGKVLSVTGKTARIQWRGKRPGSRTGIACVRDLERAKRTGSHDE